MLDAKPVATLGVIGKLQSKFDGAFLDDPTLYRGRVGALQYVTINQSNKACFCCQQGLSIYVEPDYRALSLCLKNFTLSLWLDDSWSYSVGFFISSSVCIYKCRLGILA